MADRSSLNSGVVAANCWKVMSLHLPRASKLCPSPGKTIMPFAQHVWQKIGKNCRPIFRRTTSSMWMRSSCDASESAGLILSTRLPKNVISGTWPCFSDSVPTCGRKIAEARLPWITFPWRHCNGTWFVNSKTRESSVRVQLLFEDEAVVGAAWRGELEIVRQSCCPLHRVPQDSIGVSRKREYGSIPPTPTLRAINCTACLTLSFRQKNRITYLGAQFQWIASGYISKHTSLAPNPNWWAHHDSIPPTTLAIYPPSICSQRNSSGNATLQQVETDPKVWITIHGCLNSSLHVQTFWLDTPAFERKQKAFRRSACPFQ